MDKHKYNLIYPTEAAQVLKKTEKEDLITSNDHNNQMDRRISEIIA